ncbi:hypothetical protein ACWF82_12535 [Nocardia sp. NPDC055053]
MSTTKNKKGTTKRPVRTPIGAVSHVKTIKPRVTRQPAKSRAAQAIEPKSKTVIEESSSGLEGLEPQDSPARDAKHFRRIIEARKQVAAAEAELRDAVKAAHAAGDSWTVIGMALDTSRQAAFQRFGKD